MMLILELCFRFFCCGLFAIGGGLATLPFLYNISKETGWYTFNDISNMIAVSESTPGPMGVNMATYVGFHIKGILGGLAAPLSLVLPYYPYTFISLEFPVYTCLCIIPEFKESEKYHSDIEYISERYSSPVILSDFVI
jgi:hypothetical protein